MPVNTTNIKFNLNYPIAATSSPRWCYLYQATSGGTVYSANLANSSAYDYFPNSPANNDAIYFGFRTGSNPTVALQKWRDVTLEVGTALDGTPTLIWEYYNGSWVTLTVANGNAMQSPGTQAITFEPPIDWKTLNPATGASESDGNAGFFIRCRMSSNTGVTEGGANATNLTRFGTNAIHIVDNAGGTAVTFEDIYDTAIDQGWACSPSEQISNDNSAGSYYFNCNIEIGSESYYDTFNSKTGKLDFSNSTVILESDCRLSSPQNNNILLAGTNAETIAGVARATLKTNQANRARSNIALKGIFNVYGFCWENSYKGAKPADTGGNTWEVGEFGRKTTGANGAEIVDCTFSGFRFFYMNVNSTDGIIRNTQIINCGGGGMISGSILDEIRFIGCTTGARIVTTIVGAVENAVFANTNFLLSTFALAILYRLINPDPIDGYDETSAVSWFSGNSGALLIQFSVDVEVVDQDGVAINGATVDMSPDGSDEFENFFNTVTGVDGKITRQVVTRDHIEMEKLRPVTFASQTSNSVTVDPVDGFSSLADYGVSPSGLLFRNNAANIESYSSVSGWTFLGMSTLPTYPTDEPLYSTPNGSNTSVITNYDDFTFTITADGFQDYIYIGALDAPWDCRIGMIPVVGGGSLDLTDGLIKL